jgi:formylglycine-generating enzyme required for sulfatase activity
MEAMAADLRAYLEGRVVRAHRTGALPEAIKWVGRNRLAALALAALLLVFAGSGLALLAQERARSAEQRFHADENLAPVLLAEVDGLGSIHPDSIPAYEAWEARALGLLDRVPRYRRELERLRGRAASSAPAPIPSADGLQVPEVDLEHLRFGVRLLEQELADSRRLAADPATPPGERELASADLASLPETITALRQRIEEAEHFLAEHRVFTFHSARDGERHRRLQRLVDDADRLTQPERGALALVRARLASARTLADTLEHPLWDEAIASIADVERCPRYGGLRIAPQLGLVPLWRNESTGLWEFLHVLSGAAPERGEAAALSVRPETGVVFVLLPGGLAELGVAEGGSRSAGDDWEPLEVELDPFFLSKYELTGAQYRRGTGVSAGTIASGMRAPGGARSGPTNPVESVSWLDCSALFTRWNITFPTEAQWEYGARAGSPWPWSITARAAEIVRLANLYDQGEDGRGVLDGMSEHGPVDRQEVNGFGLFGTIGNVSELCLDWKGPYVGASLPRDGDGLVTSPAHHLKVARGGSWLSNASEARVTARWDFEPAAGDWDLGVRPARMLAPLPPGERE